MFKCCFADVFTDSKGLSNPGEVEALREKVYASLEAYCKHKYPEQPGRYGCKQQGVARARATTTQAGLLCRNGMSQSWRSESVSEFT